jgi:ACS family D-galactonate transporter-like MFS transporter
MNSPLPDPALRQGAEISPVRKWLVIALLFVAVLVNYIDRGNLSIAAVPLMKDLGISPVMMGALLSAFFWTYSLAQIPGGYLVDRLDLKWVYAGAFFLWSLASAGVGIAQSFWQILVLRLALGVAEAIVQPASMGFIQKNFRGDEQGLPTSIYLAGMQAGPALGAAVGVLVLQESGWRRLFIATGLGACLWLVPWLVVAPTEGSRTSVRKPVPRITPVRSWTGLFATPLLPGVLVGSFFYSYYWYFCLIWLPSYLVMARGFSFLKMGGFTAVPLMGMAVVSIISGRVADRMVAQIKRPLFVRKRFVVFGFLLGGFILALPLMGSPIAVLLVMLASLLGIGVASANYWAVTQVISPPFMIGRVVGCQNMVANMAGICASLVTGFLVDRMKSYNLAIVLAGLSPFAAAASFAFLVREKDAQRLHRDFDPA